MQIFYDSRWIANHGIGRVAREDRDRLLVDYDLIELNEGIKPSNPFDWLYLAYQFRRSGAPLLITPGYNGSPLIGRGQIFFIHDLIHFDRSEPGGFSKRLYYDQIIRRAAGQAKLITVSDHSARQIGQRWPEASANISVVPNGISPAFLRTAKRHRTGLVLFGNGRWHKNLPRMIAAISSWQKRFDFAGRHPILIIGNADSAAALVTEHAVQGVEYRGILSDDALAQTLHSAAALLFCSLEEGFGLPIIEALACGCPVVASDISVFREIASDGCVFVNPLAEEAIVDGINEVIAGHVASGLQHDISSQFNWDRSYGMLRAVIEEALAN